MHQLVSLGEVMLRLSPPKFARLRQTDKLDVRPCGAQFNVAANFAALGGKSTFLTRLPDNELGYLCRAFAESCGVDMSHTRFAGNPKIGIVFLEFSVPPRRQVHIYDRNASAASSTEAEDFSWGQLLPSKTFAHTDGIFPALANQTEETTLTFLALAKANHCRTSFDVNYRESLWGPDQALALYRQALPLVDILVTNRNVSEAVFGYKGSDEELLRSYQRDFGCQLVCLTYKELRSHHHGRWWSLGLYQDRIISGETFEFDVVDPYGAGDAFMAGLLFELAETGSLQAALTFGNAMCALAHTLEGDQATISRDEVEALVAESSSGEFSFKTRR
jgi:2-dehydro-3-deoxygluconokinase